MAKLNVKSRESNADRKREGSIKYYSCKNDFIAISLDILMLISHWFLCLYGFPFLGGCGNVLK